MIIKLHDGSKVTVHPHFSTIKPLKITNERFPKGWETIKRLSEAIEKGCFIEALILSINYLKYYLNAILENHLINNKTLDKNIQKQLKNKYDLVALSDILKTKEIITESENLLIKNYYNDRDRAVHNFINGEINYEDIKGIIMDKFRKIETLLENKFINYKYEYKGINSKTGQHVMKISMRLRSDV